MGSGVKGNSPAGLPRRRGTAEAVSEAAGHRCAWWCPGSRWRRTWQTCTPIDPPLRRPQEEEEPRPDPPPPALDGSAPGPEEKTRAPGETETLVFVFQKRQFSDLSVKIVHAIVVIL